MALAQLLGLTFTGIDLRLTPTGDWACFEASLSPGYSYYQHHAGLPIAEALVELFDAMNMEGIKSTASRTLQSKISRHD